MRGIILCAGYGSRLGDDTKLIPKPMLDVGGAPLLEHIVRRFAWHGLREIAINVHFMPGAIRDHFGDGARFGVHLTYFYEPELLGTAGALRNAASLLGGQGPFLVHYGDICTDQDLSALRTAHEASDALATLLVHQRSHSNSIVLMDAEQRITEFLERPEAVPLGVPAERWVFSGLCFCEPAILDEIPEGRPSDLPRDLFQGLAGAGVLRGVPLTGFRCAVDSQDRLSEVRKAVAAGTIRFPWRHPDEDSVRSAL